MTDPSPQPDPDDDVDGTRPIHPPQDVPPVSAEQLVDGEVRERRYPSTIGGAFYLAVLGLTLAGLVVVVVGDWRTGIRWMASALVLGALTRTVLPPRDAGMLAVRNKWLDGGLLLGLAGALFFLATSIPDQPGP